MIELCVFKYCDVPRTSEEPPVPTTSSTTALPTPAVQVKQYSWHHNAKTNKCFYDKRREFVNLDKYSNHASFFLPQQAPLVSQAHLLSVVRKVEQSERFKGKNQHNFIVKSPSPFNREKLMTSLSLSRQKAEGKNQQDSVYADRRHSETDQIIPIYQYKTSVSLLKPSESRKEQKESKFKLPGSPNRQNVHDIIDDGINRGARRERIVNRPVARKRYVASKHSFSQVKEGLNSTLTISKQFLVHLVIICITVINFIRSGFNMSLLKLVWIVGLAVVVCQECGRARCARSADEPRSFPRYVFGGKRINVYIFPSANVYAS